MGDKFNKSAWLAAAAIFYGLFANFVCPVHLFANGNFYGEIKDIKGQVEILKEEVKRGKTAVEGMPVQLNDRIKTYANSSCNLEIDDGSIIFIDANTEASVEMLEVTSEKHNSKISLWIGRIIANITKSKKTKMELRAPTAIVAVRGTEFAVETTPDKTEVGVFDGQVGVKNSDEKIPDEVLLNQEEETSVAPHAIPERPKYLSEVMKKNKERNATLRERVKVLKERLRRTTPEKRKIEREQALERFKKLKAKRAEQREELKMKRDALKKGIDRHPDK